MKFNERRGNIIVAERVVRYKVEASPAQPLPRHVTLLKVERGGTSLITGPGGRLGRAISVIPRRRIIVYYYIGRSGTAGSLLPITWYWATQMHRTLGPYELLLPGAESATDKCIYNLDTSFLDFL
jgi:hypothetical protein